MTQRFERHARTVALLTLCSRMTGLLRDAALSRIFGAGALMDAFFFAFIIPNLFRRLFGEGALAAAFLPAYTTLHREEPETARRLASLTVALLVSALGGLVVAAEFVLYVLSARGEHGNPALWLTMIMLPYMPLVCLVAVLGAMLQVHGRFGPTAAAPIVLNLCIIAAATGGRLLAVADEQRHIATVAGAIVVAGLLQVLWSLRALREHRWVRRGWSSARPALRRVLQQAGPMMIGLGVLQLNTFFDGLIASYPTTVGPEIFGVAYPLADGAMATVSFAQRLYQFPLGVFGIAVATAIFPLLARQAGDPDAFAATMRRGLRLVVFIGLPASAGLILVREPLTAAILQGGAFSLENTRRVGFVLLGYAPAIWAYSMVHVLTRGFYARGDAKTPVRVAVSVVALNLALNCSLIWTPLEEAALAWSTAACSTIQAFVLLSLLRRRVGFAVGREVLGSWGRTAGVTLVMSAAVWAVALTLPASASWWGWLGQLAAMVVTGALVVVASAAVLRMPELSWAIGREKADR